jgi:hypothetical protein
VHARSLIATHQRVRVARDEAEFGITRCGSASANTATVTAGRIRLEAHHVAHILNQRRAFVTEAPDPLCTFCMDASLCGDAFTNLPSHV